MIDSNTKLQKISFVDNKNDKRIHFIAEKLNGIVDKNIKLITEKLNNYNSSKDTVYIVSINSITISDMLASRPGNTEFEYVFSSKEAAVLFSELMLNEEIFDNKSNNSLDYIISVSEKHILV